MLLFALLPLLIAIACLAIAFYYWRRYPILKNAINLKRPFWLALFASIGIGAVGFAGALGLDRLSKYFTQKNPPNMFGNPFDAMIILCLVLAVTGFFCSFLSAVWCIWRLISALLSHLRSLHVKR